jgi:hypothetical protein
VTLENPPTPILAPPSSGSAAEAASSTGADDEARSWEAPASHAADREGEALAAIARELLGRTVIIERGRRYPNECTGLVRAVYARHGVDLFAGADSSTGGNGVAAIWRFARHHGTLHRDDPRPGDLVFFSETYDRNRDGRVNDGLTHVGIVERTLPDGTVYFIHRIAGRVVRYCMNLEYPQQRKDPIGRIVNDWLRMGRPGRLAGELFSGYGTLAAPRDHRALSAQDIEMPGANGASASRVVARRGWSDGLRNLSSASQPRRLGSEAWPCGRRK